MRLHRRAGTVGRRLDRRMLRSAAVLLPPAITVLWIPLRQRLPDVDVALALVLAVTACGMTARRSHVVLAAIGAAAGFAFFDTRPYQRFVISRQPDLETLILLVVVSLVTGELAVRATRLRVPAPAGEGMERVRDVAALVASGAELASVLGGIGDELTRLLGAGACSYEAGDAAPGAVVVDRHGALRRQGDGALGATGPLVAGVVGVEVPVTGMDQVLGRFVLSRPDPAALRGEALLVALTLADQAGAALIAQAPESAQPPPPSAPRPALRVVE